MAKHETDDGGGHPHHGGRQNMREPGPSEDPRTPTPEAAPAGVTEPEGGPGGVPGSAGEADTNVTNASNKGTNEDDEDEEDDDEDAGD